MTDADALVSSFSHPFGVEILRCEVGSTAYGTGVAGTDDLDMLAVVVPPIEKVVGLNEFDDALYRSAIARGEGPGAKSKPGDVDLSFYSLKKFARLAQKGNPSTLCLFFGPVLHIDPCGTDLRASADLFRSKSAGYQFLGYMRSQRMKMAGERGQKRVNRPDLIEKYGYDTKYAYHLVRLGIQGLEFIQNGRITIPVNLHVRDLLLAIREGGYTLERIIQWSHELELELEQAIEASGLPDKAPPEPIDRLVVNLHQRIWDKSKQATLNNVQRASWNK